MGAEKQRTAANFANILPKGGVTFTLPNDYTVTVETMPRDDITDLALLTFAKMGSVTSLQDIQTEAETICKDLGKKSPTAEEIAQRVKSTFLKKPELASLMQHSIRNPRSGEEAWALASQVGEPNGRPDPTKLQAQTFPAEGTTMQEQLDFVKQINLSNLATGLGISGFPRNAINQTIKDKEGNPVMVTTGVGTPDNSNAEAAQQVMQSLPKNASMVALLAESGTFVSRLSNGMKFLGLTRIHKVTSEESNTGNILQKMKLPEGMTADSVSAYSRSIYAVKPMFYGKTALEQYVEGTINETKSSARNKLATVNQARNQVLRAIKPTTMNTFENRYLKALQSIGKPDDDNRTLAIALASYVKSKVSGNPIVMFCKSGKDRTGAVVNMTTAIAMLDDQLKQENKGFDLGKKTNMNHLADNYRMLQQTGVRNFISGLNSEGAGVLNGVELLPKAFKDYYKSEYKGQKFLAELVVAKAVGKQNKGWKEGEKNAFMSKTGLGTFRFLGIPIPGVNSISNFIKYNQLTVPKKGIGKIYHKGLDALDQIEKNYETREVQMAALQVISKSGQLNKEMNKSKKIFFGMIPTPFSHYSDAQKASMQSIIDGVQDGKIKLGGKPGDLLKQIQVSTGSGVEESQSVVVNDDLLAGERDSLLEKGDRFSERLTIDRNISTSNAVKSTFDNGGNVRDIDRSSLHEIKGFSSVQKSSLLSVQSRAVGEGLGAAQKRVDQTTAASTVARQEQILDDKENKKPSSDNIVRSDHR